MKIRYFAWLRERLNRGEVTKQEYEAKLGVGVPSENTSIAPAAKVAQVDRAVAPVAVASDIRQTLPWQIWFWVLGLMGFFASLILALQGKKWMMETFRHNYEEGGRWGNASDIFTIGFTFLYAIAFWMVGWGSWHGPY